MRYYTFNYFFEIWIIYVSLALLTWLLLWKPMCLENNSICETSKLNTNKSLNIDKSCETIAKEKIDVMNFNPLENDSAINEQNPRMKDSLINMILLNRKRKLSTNTNGDLKLQTLLNIGTSLEDSVNFNPIKGEGAMGKGVIIPPEEIAEMEKQFKINSFNLLASDRIPLNRTLFDCRSDRCRLEKYPKDLPNTSIIIIFHNEAWSVLLRTIWSIITRTPKHLLKEIILVDDASEREFLKNRLDEYIEELPVSIKIIRMGERKGIVQARLAGAKIARGNVLTFLDAHCECSIGWAEPLLKRIKYNRNIVVCPVIDVVFYDDFRYEKAIEYHWGAFNWQLIFNWYQLDDVEIHKKGATYTYKPTKTPALSGGLFSINRDYFFEMGGYDPELIFWGGENIEMSFRIWQCGGQIEIHPCSHVGHLFRQNTPYSFPGGKEKMLSNNIGRAALVWMDEWSDFFFMYNLKELQYFQTNLNVTERLKLRKRLKCKPFSWYLKNIWPLNFFPGHDRFFGKLVVLTESSKITPIYEKIKNKFIGRSIAPTKWSDIFQIIWNYNKTLSESLNSNEDSCLQPYSGNDIPRTNTMFPVTIDACISNSNLQDFFVITPGGHIMTNLNKCLDYIQINGELSPTNTNVRLFDCTDNDRQHWRYNLKTNQIIHKKSKLCLTMDALEDNEHIFLTAEECSMDEDIYHLQIWGFVPFPWHK